MVNSTNINETNFIVREKLGKNTGDTLLQTADGKWWLEHKTEYVKVGERIKVLWR